MERNIVKRVLPFLFIFGLMLLNPAKVHAVAPSVSNPTATAIDLGGGNMDKSTTQLGATVNPQGLSTSGFFLWGDKDPGSDCKVLPNYTRLRSGFNSGSSGVSFQTTTSATDATNPAPSGFTPGRKYWFCAVAFNSAGITYSAPTFFIQAGSACTASNGSQNTSTTGTDFSIDTTTCSFASPIDGADKGTGDVNTSVLRIAKNKALNVDPGQTVAYGVIFFAGASIVKAPGGSIVRGSVWIQDGDHDGAPDYADNVDPTKIASPGAIVVNKTQPTGYIRKSSTTQDRTVSGNSVPAGTIDCAPGDFTRWQLLQGVQDFDGDGVPGNPYVQSTCAGNALPSGYAASVTTADCNDGNANIYQNVGNLVQDTDTDGYKTAPAAATQCVGAATANYNSSGRTYYKDSGGINSTWLDAGATLNGGSTDCNDSVSYVYTNQTVATDADHDGYGTTTASSQCAGALSANYLGTGRSYYTDINNHNYYVASASMLGNSDCDDNLATGGSKWQNGWTDADGDNYATDAIGSPTCLGSTTTGYTLSPVGYTDCAPSFSGLNTTCAPAVTTTAVSSVGSNSATFNGTATAATWTGTGNFKYDRWPFTSCASLASSSATTVLTTSPTSNPSTTLTNTPADLIGNTSWYYCATATNNWNGSTTTTDADGNKQSFLTKPGVATAVNPVPASATSMTVSWTNPPGSAVSYNVKWCTGASCVPGVSGTQFNTSTNVSSPATITGLTGSGQTYYFIVSAINATGSTDTGSIPQILGTAPSVFTSVPTASAAASVIFNSTVNPNYLTTHVDYRWGTSNVACGSLPNVQAGPTGLTGSSPLSGATTQATLNTGLTSNTVYYFCATATNGVATTSAGVIPFTTAPATVGAPTASYVIAGNYNSVSWSAISAGGSAGSITYKVYYCNDGSNTCTPNSLYTTTASTSTTPGATCSQYNRYAITSHSSTGIDGVLSGITTSNGGMLGGSTTCYSDSDGDGQGAAAYGSGTYCGGCPSAYVTNNNDCNGGSGYVYQTITAATDADHDGYIVGSGTSGGICAGGTSSINGRTYYNDTSNAYSYITGSWTGTSDCYDVNNAGGQAAHSGQTSWYTTNRGDGSFDYDCNGSTINSYNSSTVPVYFNAVTGSLLYDNWVSSCSGSCPDGYTGYYCCSWSCAVTGYSGVTSTGYNCGQSYSANNGAAASGGWLNSSSCTNNSGSGCAFGNSGPSYYTCYSGYAYNINISGTLSCH